MAEAKRAIASGRPVIIFPEGTRVPPGAAPALQPGFAGLYRALGLPVVPVAHDVGRLWHKGFLKRSGTVHFKVGDVILGRSCQIGDNAVIQRGVFGDSTSIAEFSRL